jgi:hypothetical protein
MTASRDPLLDPGHECSRGEPNRRIVWLITLLNMQEQLPVSEPQLIMAPR